MLSSWNKVIIIIIILLLSSQNFNSRCFDGATAIFIIIIFITFVPLYLYTTVTVD